MPNAPAASRGACPWREGPAASSQMPALARGAVPRCLGSWCIHLLAPFRAYIVGEFVPWDPSFNDATVTLTRGDEFLDQAAMSDALGGPEPGVRWLWQEARERRFQCEEGTLFLGGACGALVPAEVGRCLADFGSLGEIDFEITATR